MSETLPPDEDNGVHAATEGVPGVEPDPKPELYTDDQEQEDDEDGS
jgi:hypothetical protein